MTAAPATLIVFYEKARRADEEADWLAWQQGEHRADLLGTGATAVAFTQLTPKPIPGMPGIGFSHVTLVRYENGERDVNPPQIMRDIEERGRLHDSHTLIDAEVFTAHGRWTEPAPPDVDVHGHILTHVMPNLEDLEADWDRWYDDIHVPDMMTTGAFASATRWIRRPRRQIGPNHITLYDITHRPVETAVDMSAAALPSIIKAGRKHQAHTGAMTLVLEKLA